MKSWLGCATVLAILLLLKSSKCAAGQTVASAGGTQSSTSTADVDDCLSSAKGSPYIQVDSWIYPAVMRLNGLGYVDQVYLNLRPWTRASLSHILEGASDYLDIDQEGPTATEAKKLLRALQYELRNDNFDSCNALKATVIEESAYTVVRGMTGTPLHDSFHIGSTIINDYGRPYSNGLNNYSGISGYATSGRFALYLRGEFEGAPSFAGYSTALTNLLAQNDGTSDYFSSDCLSNGTGCVPMPNSLQTTIPFGPIGSKFNGRILEAYVSAQYLNHVISFGKQDEWLGPAMGASMAYSNNAENVYAFHINRIEPLYIPLLSKITGPFRYEFLVGPLKGHTYPADPWVHVEKVGFKPTRNLELGFERTVIWGGKNHQAINLKTFARSFFSLSAPDPAVKVSSKDPGARFGAFDFSYRLPFLRNWLTLYADSEVHDDVSPIDAPRRASWRPGLYLSHVPFLPKLDMRIEGVTTDPPVLAANVTVPNSGHFMYWESLQRQGYTNSGQIFGDWIGREDKGGQAWVTYHLSGNELVQVSLRNQKAEKDFIPQGTTVDDVNFNIAKRIGKDFEIKGDFELEHWKAPIYLPGQQTVTSTSIQVTWYPGEKFRF